MSKSCSRNTLSFHACHSLNSTLTAPDVLEVILEGEHDPLHRFAFLLDRHLER